MTGNEWTPERVGKWKRHIADFLSYLLAVFLVVYGTLNATELGVTIVGLMFTLAAGFLGVPHMLRLDRRSSGKDSEE